MKPLIPFKTFAEAWKSLPRFISPDPLYHKRINDLAFLVRHELDLYDEGESNEIVGHPDAAKLQGSYNARRGHRLAVARRYYQCVRFIKRCGEEV